MAEIKQFCTSCGKDMIIKEINRDSQGEILTFVCGHRVVKTTHMAVVNITALVETKHKNECGKLLERYKYKVSGQTKRPARDCIVIDRDKKKLIHRVWEQDESGKWHIKHFHEKHFPIQ